MASAWDVVADDRWKCNTCSLKWEASLIQCKACESYRPGLTEAEIATIKGEEEKRTQADIAKFRSPASGQGFSFATGSSAPSAPQAGFSFGGASAATPSSFSFGTPATSGFSFGAATTGAPAATGFSFGAPPAAPGSSGAPAATGFSFGAPPAAPGFSFGASAGGISLGTPSGSSGSSAAPLFGGSAGPSTGGFTFISNAPSEVKPIDEEKSYAFPDFASDAIPVGDVFVHGSGECDQLGLGDSQRERRKPTLVKGLNSMNIHEIAVGALHVLCVADTGRLFSWGCNDDGALGRAAGDTDCEPHPVSMPPGVSVRKVSCGDCHSCALDNLERVWLWGTYKDSNGHIGISQKRKHESQTVVEKCADPVIVLDSCSQIASGANHTVAFTSPRLHHGPFHHKVFSWGSNATGQLGLKTGEGCGFEERVVPSAEMTGKLQDRSGGGTEADGLRIVRLIEASGKERDAMNLKPADVEQAVRGGISSLVLEVPEREVPKAEKRALLDPKEVYLGEISGHVTGAFASAECTFVIADESTYGCGLNGDAQVGLGFASMAVRTLRLLPTLKGASWIGGGLHVSAALVKGEVFTWGKGEECGHGSSSTAPIMVPRAVTSLPKIRTLRCGGHHTLACSESGDVFAWGCGLTYQLGNRPRNVDNKDDADEDPEDELKPYRISSKQLDSRFVLVADGGAQHSVELAWNKSQSRLRVSEVGHEGVAEVGHEMGTAGEPAQKKTKLADTATLSAKSDTASTVEAVSATMECEGNAVVNVPGQDAPVSESLMVPPPSIPEGEEKKADTADTEAIPNLFGFSMPPDDRWKCDVCSLRWKPELLQCGACEAFRPGLSEADIAKAKAAEEEQKQATISKFLGGGASSPATGFSFGAQPNPSPGFSFASQPNQSTGFSFATQPNQSSGFSFAPQPTQSVGFSFGAQQNQSNMGGASQPNQSVGFSFGAQPSQSSMGSASPTEPSGFHFSPSPAKSSEPAAFTFGSAPAIVKEKQLATLPDFKQEHVPVGDVFVHGSGECDQLGLGDDQRERQKPTIIRDLSNVCIYDLAVGAMHVLCVTSEGRLYSWGCNDDGALGRPSDGDSDCVPHLAGLPTGVVARKVSCGDCHSCALDNLGRAWLWGTYKDSNGHIGIAVKSKQDAVLEKSAEPAIVLENCSQIASGANHTVALASSASSTSCVFAWGSNGTGQLGLLSGKGCGFEEKVLSTADTIVGQLQSHEGGGIEIDGLRIVRLITKEGKVKSALTLKVGEVQLKDMSKVVLEVPEREVPKPEKKDLLVPQVVSLDAVAGAVSGVFASCDCTFVVSEGRAYGCGLNGDGQVGLGFVSMAVRTLHMLPKVQDCSWLGGCLHTSVALANGQVFTWGKADECGHGMAAKAEPLMDPRAIALPRIRTVRCGIHHMLATSEAGDVFAWGCGLTHQLANRPRDFSNPSDKEEDPDDELKPYRVSSKQLEDRFVLLADGGAQHSVELAWDGKYQKLVEATEHESKGGFGLSSAPLAKGFSFGNSGVAPVASPFGASPASGSGFSLGSSSAVPGAAPPPSFSFGGTVGTGMTTPSQTFAFGSSAPAPLGSTFSFGSSSGSTSSAGTSFSFGTGSPSSQPSSTGFTFQAATAQPLEEKRNVSAPDFAREDVPIGDVFVHGSGECDQLGLGDEQRERKKPTIIRGLASERIHCVAVGALHVLCVTIEGRVFSWGCNDDGALGRISDGDSDCEPHPIELPARVCKVSCGDNHSCALDSQGSVWLWGTYKDSNGHIGISQKRKQDAVLEKSAEPIIVLERCVQIASGANHTVALKHSAGASTNTVFAWGSNGTGQLGLEGGEGCGYAEKVMPATQEIGGRCKARTGGGVELDGMQIVRLVTSTDVQKNTMAMKLDELMKNLATAVALVLEVPEREVPKQEKKALLIPQLVSLSKVSGDVSSVFASADCTFVTAGDQAYGCGLNGDAQVGLGFASMAVQTLQPLPNVKKATWLGGCLHSSVALVEGDVLTWGKADECGHGLASDSLPLKEPRPVTSLPKIRAVRCGGHHMLATSQAGDVFVWGCGLTYQLGNRPRDFSNPSDKDDEPEDELRPYRLSSKQLESRYVILADGGAQHSVELAWNGQYEKLSGVSAEIASEIETRHASVESPADEPAAKRLRTSSLEDMLEVGEQAADTLTLGSSLDKAVTDAAMTAADEEDEEEAAAGTARAEAEVLHFFSGDLLSEHFLTFPGRHQKHSSAPSPAIEPESARVLWTACKPSGSEAAASAVSKHESVSSAPALVRLTLPRSGKLADLQLQAQVGSLSRHDLEDLLLDATERDDQLREAIPQRCQKAEEHGMKLIEAAS